MWELIRIVSVRWFQELPQRMFRAELRKILQNQSWKTLLIWTTVQFREQIHSAIHNPALAVVGSTCMTQSKFVCFLVLYFLHFLGEPHYGVSSLPHEILLDNVISQVWCVLSNVYTVKVHQTKLSLLFQATHLWYYSWKASAPQPVVENNNKNVWVTEPANYVTNCSCIVYIFIYL